LRIRQGRFAEAEPLATKVLDGMVRVQGPNHADTLEALHTLIHVLEKQGKDAAAEPLHRRFVEAHRAKDGAESPAAARTAYQFGRCLIRQKKFADAEPVFRDCVRVFEKGKPTGWTAGSKRLLGESLVGQKKHVDAEPLLLAGYEGFKALEPTPDNRRITTESMEVLIRFYDDWGKKDKADVWRKALAEAKAAK